MASTAPSLLRFAEFEVDLRAGQLRKQGTKIRLQEQPFRVLTALLESSGEVVTRDELRSRLWAADTFVDFDHRLAAAVSKLRDALGDAAESPTFIETVGRRGYRFLRPLEPSPVPESAATAAPSEPDLPSPSAGSSRWRPALRRGALGLLVVVGVVLLGRGRTPGAAL